MHPAIIQTREGTTSAQSGYVTLCADFVFHPVVQLLVRGDKAPSIRQCILMRVRGQILSVYRCGVAHSTTGSPKRRGAGAFALQIEPRWMQLCSCRRAINNQRLRKIVDKNTSHIKARCGFTAKPFYSTRLLFILSISVFL